MHEKTTLNKSQDKTRYPITWGFWLHRWKYLHSGNFLHSVGTMWIINHRVVIFFTVLALCGSMWTQCGKLMSQSGNFLHSWTLCGSMWTHCGKFIGHIVVIFFIVWALCGSMWTHCGKFMPHSGNFLHSVGTMWFYVNTLWQINVTEW